MLNYLLGALIGGCMGLVSAFFAYGGLRQKKLFARLLKRKGRWHRSFALLCVLGAGIGVYAVWLYGGLGRNFWAMMLLSCYLLAVSVTDLRHRIIPDDCSAVFAVVFILFRSFGKILGAYGSCKAAGCEEKVTKYLGITLLPQAGVALGMALTAASLPNGALARNVVLFAVLVYELVGPALTKRSLLAVGDIKPEGRTSARVLNKENQ